MEGEAAEDPALFPATVGEKLRAAREAQGATLEEIAARTRIPQRHLEAIERGNYAGLPSITYALGFAKAYARAVDADEVAIARDLRIELNRNPERAAPIPAYETSDPKRVPPSSLAWAGAIVALLVLVGVGLWYGTDWFRGGAPAPESIIPVEATNTSAPAAIASTPVPANGGQVTLIALDKVWIRVTDAKDQRLFERELQPGERYDVPADADHPKIRTGGPEKLQVTINGSNVDPLGPGGQTVNAEISADALRARGKAASPTPTPTASPRPRPSASATPAATATARRPTTAPQPVTPPIRTETAPGNVSTAP
jgi:cytoskeleton protein RodZ